MAEITLKLLDTKRIIPIGKDGFEINVENKNGGMVIAGENNVSMMHLVFTKEFLQNNKDKINTDDEIVVTILNANNEYTIVNESYDEADVTTSGTWLMDVPITSAMTFVGYTKVFIQWKSANNSIFVWERFDLKVWSTDPNYIPGTNKKYVPEDFVEANPDGTPTKDLSTIKIDDTIYNVRDPSKLDKVTKSGLPRVYGISPDGSQLTFYALSIVSSGSTTKATVMMRDTNGRVEVANPVNSLEAVNKQFLDNESDRLQNLIQDNHDDITELNNRISEQETEIEGIKLYAQSTQEEVNELRASLYGYVFGEDTASFDKIDISALPRMINNVNVADNTRLALNNITGRAIKWTQLVNTSLFKNTQTISGVTFTFNKTNGTITCNGTATEDISFTIMNPDIALNSLWTPADYAYMKGCPTGGSESTYYLLWANTSMEDTGNGIYYKPSGDVSAITDTTNIYTGLKIVIKSGTTMTNKVFYPQLFNVSNIYGLSKEPATKEDFDKDYILQVYPYGNADIKPTKVSGIKIKAGYASLINANSFPDTKTINGITFTNNGNGTITVNGTATGRAIYNGKDLFIDTTVAVARKKFLLKGCPSGGSESTYYLRNDWSEAKDIGAGAIFGITNSANKTMVNTKCSIIVEQGAVCKNLVFKPQLVNLSTCYGIGNEPTTVAQFNQDFPDIDNIPYPEQTISFPEQELYGINDIQDTLQVVKKDSMYEVQLTKNISNVDMGTLTYEKKAVLDETLPDEYYWRAQYSNHFEIFDAYHNVPNILTSKYYASKSELVANADSQHKLAYNKAISYGGNYNAIMMRDTSYTEASDLKTALNGQILYYADRNPTTTTIATLTASQVTAMFTKGYCVEILGNDDNKIIVRPNLKLDMVVKLIGGNTNE